MKILLVEDDQIFVALVKKALSDQHYLVDVANDGETGLKLAQLLEYDLILLDLNLPKLSGVQFCQRLRCQDINTPILVITVDNSSKTKVQVLDTGADDYIVKPFNLPELLARIRALIRRKKYPILSILNWHGLILDPSTKKIAYNNQRLQLEAKEYSILELLFRNPQRIFSQYFLLEYLGSEEEICSHKHLRYYLDNLAQIFKKLGFKENLIKNIYGLGYRLKTDSDLPLESDNKHKKQPEKLPQSNLNSTNTFEKSGEDENHLQEVWHKYKYDYYERLETVTKALEKLNHSYLTTQEQEKAIREAHTLAGALGMFGFPEASVKCREIENKLKSSIRFSQKQLKHLEQLLFAIKQEIYWESTTSKAENTTNLDIQSNFWNKSTLINQDNLTDYPDLNHPSPIPGYLQNALSVLVIDDDPALTDILCSEGILWGFNINAVSSINEARKAIQDSLPDLILLDLNFPETDNNNGLILLQELTTNYPSIPVIVMTGSESFEKRLEVVRLGGQGFLQKPVNPEQVMGAIVQTIEQSALPVGKLMIVNNDSWMLYLLRLLLEPWGFQLILLENPQNFWDVLEQSNPDLLIIDIEMGDLNGIELCKVVRNDPQWYNLPIIVLSSNIEPNVVEEVFTVGADDYVRKPIVGPELIARVLNRLEKVQMRRKIAEIDDLTRVANRRKSVQEFTRLIHLANRQQQHFCFVILDLDHFKEINDNYGHDIGDKVLKTLGKLLNQSFRGEDIVGRWGGEEFVIGLYGTTKTQALQRLNNILNYWSQQKFNTPNNTSFSVTFSGGLAQYPEDGANLPALYHNADLALYHAKSQGRNQIAILETRE